MSKYVASNGKKKWLINNLLKRDRIPNVTQLNETLARGDERSTLVNSYFHIIFLPPRPHISHKLTESYSIL